MDIIEPDPLGHLILILLNVAGAGLSVGVMTGILWIMLLLIASALVSGAEVAFFSLGPNQLHELRLREDRHDLAVLRLVETPQRLLATILISNNFINVAIIVISTFVTNSLFDFTKQPYWLVFLIQVIVVTALILIMAEILPKVYANRRNLELARFMSGPFQLLIRVFYPLSSILIHSTNLIERKISRKKYNLSMSELSDAIELTSGENAPAEEKKILRGIVKFGDIEVKEIMRSRVDVLAVDITTSFKELLQMIIEAGYSRIPVYEDSFDQVKGILYIKDLLPFLDKDENFKWTSLLRDAFFVPENKKINDLLQEFQEKKIHMAVVVDEYGGTSGIVTLEDIIEEIVGEISDEHDELVGDIDYSQLDDHNFLFEGKTSLNDFCKILGIDDDIFDAVKGDADSLAGLILELLEKMPVKDEKVSFEQFTFTAKAVDNRRIKQVLVTIAETPEEEDA